MDSTTLFQLTTIRQALEEGAISKAVKAAKWVGHHTLDLPGKALDLAAWTKDKADVAGVVAKGAVRQGPFDMLGNAAAAYMHHKRGEGEVSEGLAATAANTAVNMGIILGGVRSAVQAMRAEPKKADSSTKEEGWKDTVRAGLDYAGAAHSGVVDGVLGKTLGKAYNTVGSPQLWAAKALAKKADLYSGDDEAQAKHPYVAKAFHTAAAMAAPDTSIPGHTLDAAVDAVRSGDGTAAVKHTVSAVGGAKKLLKGSATEARQLATVRELRTRLEQLSTVKRSR